MLKRGSACRLKSDVRRMRRLEVLLPVIRVNYGTQGISEGGEMGLRTWVGGWKKVVRLDINSG